MKIKKLLLCISFIIPLFLCCSCGLFGDQEYVCEVDSVESVQIVRLDKYIEGEYRYEYTTLSTITDYSTFIDRLNQVDHSVNWGDPGRFDLNYIVIKIDYHNGDYDLLYPNAQCFHRSGVNQNGYFFFDEKQLQTLISDYIKE